MSSLDSLNLPPVINAPTPVAPLVASNDKATLVLCSKELSATDKAIFAEYGTVVIWCDKYINVPLDQITPFDYLICDMNSKNLRLTLGRTDLSKYNIVSYVSVIQKAEDFIAQIPCNNILTSIPREAVHKADFDSMLQNAKLISPSMIKSFLKWLIGCLSK